MNALHTFLSAGNVQARPVLGDAFNYGTQTGLTGFFSSADEKTAFELGGTLDEMDRILVVGRDQFEAANLPKVDDTLEFGGALLQVRALREDASAFVLGLKMLSAQPDRQP